MIREADMNKRDIRGIQRLMRLLVYSQDLSTINRGNFD